MDRPSPSPRPSDPTTPVYTSTPPTAAAGPALRISILDATGTPAAAQTVTAMLSSASVAALTLTLRKASPDGSAWVSRNAVAPLPGTWTLNLTVALTNTDAYATSATYHVW